MQLSAFPSLLDPTSATPAAANPGAPDDTASLPHNAATTDFGALLTTQTGQPVLAATPPAVIANSRLDGQLPCAGSPLANGTVGSPLAPVLGATSAVPAFAPAVSGMVAADPMPPIAATAAPMPRPVNAKPPAVACTSSLATPVTITPSCQNGLPTGSSRSDGAADSSSEGAEGTDGTPADSDDDAQSTVNPASPLPHWMPAALAELQAIVGSGLSEFQFSTSPSAEAISTTGTGSAPGVATAGVQVGPAVTSDPANPTTTAPVTGRLSSPNTAPAIATATAFPRGYQAASIADTGVRDSTDQAGVDPALVPDADGMTASDGSAPNAPAGASLRAVSSEDVDTDAPAVSVGESSAGNPAEVSAAPLSVLGTPASLSRQATQVQRAFGLAPRLSSTPMPNVWLPAPRVLVDDNAKPSPMTAPLVNADAAPSPSLAVVPPVTVDATVAPISPAGVAAPLEKSAPAAHLADPREGSANATVSTSDQTAAAAPIRAGDIASIAVAPTQTAMVSGTRILTPQRGIGGRAEKIAATSAMGTAASVRASSDGEKTGLVFSDEQLTSSDKPLGINAAQSEALMPAPAHNPAARPDDPLPFVAASAAAEAAMKDAAATATPEIVRAATRAVDAALAMADHFSNGAQRGVSLQFSVSGVDLAVRVEMRADGVHTTFRTDSPELRAALAQEWQAVASGQSSDKPLRLAEPVFTSQAANSFSADSGAANQRQPGARQNLPAAPGQSSAFADARQATTETAVPTPTPTRWAGLVSTSHHLHTFA